MTWISTVALLFLFTVLTNTQVRFFGSWSLQSMTVSTV